MSSLQKLIHRLEVAGGTSYLQIAVVALALVLGVFGYNIRAFKNMSTQEAMDSAQLARNIADGRGYTTRFIRPYSMHLLKNRAQSERAVPALGAGVPDDYQLKNAHPDISNPPVYPVVLAGLMKVLPFRYEIDVGAFKRSQPDLLIALFNQALLFGVVLLAFVLAKRMFNLAVAGLSAALVLGTELFWRFAFSGQSTTLLMLIFLGLCWFLLRYAEAAAETPARIGRLLLFAAVAGVLVALGGLTRYSFAWLIVPVLFFVVLAGNERKAVPALLTAALFLALFVPWLVRNYSLSGQFFGTATYTVLEGTFLWPADTLQRTLEPNVAFSRLDVVGYKLLVNLLSVAQGDLVKLAGTWLSIFFLVGLMITLPAGGARSLRQFLLAALAVLLVVQALGRTQLSEASPEVNSENLLVLLSPLFIIYGVSLFFTLLSKVSFEIRELKKVTIVGFALLASSPLILTFLPPTRSPIAFPPYYPPILQQAGALLKPHEIAMSDMPWATAWYGGCKSIWLTATPKEMVTINDYHSAISMLLLSPVTTDLKLSGELLKSSWGVYALGRVPKDFPLKSVWNPGLLPQFIIVTDRPRGASEPSQPPATP